MTKMDGRDSAECQNWRKKRINPLNDKKRNSSHLFEIQLKEQKRGILGGGGGVVRDLQ